MGSTELALRPSYWASVSGGKEDGVKEFAEKLKEYINDKVVEEFYDMVVDVRYLTIDIDEFEEYVDELLKEYEK